MSQPRPDYDAQPRPQATGPATELTPPSAPPPRPAAWIQKASAVLFCVFCFEVGAFLIVYPWLDAWRDNYLFQLRPQWSPFLLSHQFRGAVTGLGILNIFIAFGEIFRLRRFVERD